MNCERLDVSDCVVFEFFLEGVAALLLQGSIQVYSRKVEYLYSLVLRVLEFLSEKRFDCCIQFSFLISARYVDIRNLAPNCINSHGLSIASEIPGWREEQIIFL